MENLYLFSKPLNPLTQLTLGLLASRDQTAHKEVDFLQSSMKSGL